VQKQPAQVQPSEEQKGTTKQVEQKRTPSRTAPTTAPVTAVPPKAKPTPPTASPVTAAKPQKRLVYSVQLGAYKSKQNADALVKSYKQKGYDAFTQKSTTAAKGTLYRVLIGKFDTKNKATFLMREIRNKENVSAIIYHGKV
jgi:cell division septation protein DedD